MKLNNLDARAVDAVLDGLANGIYPAGNAAGDGAAVGFAPAGPTSAMNDDLAHRVTNVDAMMKLLDYLPADEPPSQLVQRTMGRVRDARSDARIGFNTDARAAAASMGGNSALGQSIRHSPNAGGDEDPATA